MNKSAREIKTTPTVSADVSGASPAVQGLMQEQAEALIGDMFGYVEDLEPIAFVRWLSDRMYQDACKIARLTRTEKGA